MAEAKPRVRVKAISQRVARAEAGSSIAARPLGPRVVRWNPGFSGPNATQDWDLATKRSRSRDEVKKNGLADAALEVLVTNIVGSGIKPQFTTAIPALNKELAERWLQWTDEADADGRLDFYGLQMLAVRSMIEGGDVFGRMRARQISDGLSVPLQIQVLEAEYCSELNNRAGALSVDGRPSVNPIRAGVEFNLIGQRAAYHMTREHPTDGIVLGAASNLIAIPVPASEVVHLAVIRRPGQVRGEPWLSRAIAKLHDLDSYDDAQLVRQKIAALFAGFVRDEASEDGDEEAIFADQGDPDDSGLALASLEPGTMQVLRRGQAVDWSDPPSPGDNYEAFVREQKRGVAGSVGIMYEQLSGDYSQVNDRTFRASVNEFRRRCEMWQHHNVVFQFCRPILRRWVEFAVLSGAVRLPAGVTPAMAAQARWVPQGWSYINPVQDVQAKQAEVRAGFRSRSATVSADGYDAAQIDAEQSEDAKRADGLGLVYDSDPRKTARSGGKQDDEPAPVPEPAAT